MPAATRDGKGLADELRSLASWIEEQAEIPCLVGETSDSHDSYVHIETVRIAISDADSSRTSVRVNADVMVVAHGSDHAAMAETVAMLMLRALTTAHWELLRDQPDLELWSALGQPPRPSFMISIPLRLPIRREVAPVVRKPLDVRGGQLRRVQGRVLAADGTPLAGAIVRLTSGGPPMTTAHDGRWTLSVPHALVHLDVTARGAHAIHDLPSSPNSAADAHNDIDIVLTSVGAPSTTAAGRAPGAENETEN